jgi:hypothetical protein
VLKCSFQASTLSLHFILKHKLATWLFEWLFGQLNIPWWVVQYGENWLSVANFKTFLKTISMVTQKSWTPYWDEIIGKLIIFKLTLLLLFYVWKKNILWPSNYYSVYMRMCKCKVANSFFLSTSSFPKPNFSCSEMLWIVSSVVTSERGISSVQNVCWFRTWAINKASQLL